MNGLNDGILNGTGTNAGGTLYAMLVDPSGNLVDSFPVKSDGTFILGGATGGLDGPTPILDGRTGDALRSA